MIKRNVKNIYMLKKKEEEKRSLVNVVKQNLIISLQAVNLVLRCGRINRLAKYKFSLQPVSCGHMQSHATSPFEGGGGVPGKDHTIGATSYHRRPLVCLYTKCISGTCGT